MVFGVATLVAYISRFMTLEPAISSPPHAARRRHGAEAAGVPEAGDVMTLGIDGWASSAALRLDLSGGPSALSS